MNTVRTLNFNPENEIDGEAFLQLSESNLKEMIPNKIGIVKKIQRLQEKVSLIDIFTVYNYDLCTMAKLYVYIISYIYT